MQAAADILTLFPKKSQNPNSAHKCPITSIQVCIESQKLSEFSCITSGSLERGYHTFQPLFLKVTDFCPWERTMRGGGVCLDNTTLPARLETRNQLRPCHCGLIPVYYWSVSFSYLRSAAGVSFDIKKACRKPYNNNLSVSNILCNVCGLSMRQPNIS